MLLSRIPQYQTGSHAWYWIWCKILDFITLLEVGKVNHSPLLSIDRDIDLVVSLKNCAPSLQRIASRWTFGKCPTYSRTSLRCEILLDLFLKRTCLTPQLTPVKHKFRKPGYWQHHWTCVTECLVEMFNRKCTEGYKQPFRTDCKMR